MIIQPVDTGNKTHPYGHALVAGIERYPAKITRRMSKARQEKRSKIKPFVKVVNYNHLMPTRYTLELEGLKGALTSDTFKEVSQREDAKKTVKKTLEERYTSGKNRWFFTPLSMLSSLPICPAVSHSTTSGTLARVELAGGAVMLSRHRGPCNVGTDALTLPSVHRILDHFFLGFGLGGANWSGLDVIQHQTKNTIDGIHQNCSYGHIPDSFMMTKNTIGNTRSTNLHLWRSSIGQLREGGTSYQPLHGRNVRRKGAGRTDVLARDHP